MNARGLATQHPWGWPLAAVGLLVALGACGGDGETSSSMEMAPKPEQATVAEEPREVIRNASMSVRVDDVRASVGRVTAITQGAGGRIASENLNASGEALYADITARVPADRLDSVIAEVSALGTVTTVTITAEDVTAQGADLDARIEALTTSVNRLQELLATATTTKDLVEIERELSSRQAELDSLVAQRELLSEAVALSTLSVSLTPSSDVAEWTPPGFVSGLESGWNALRTLTAAAVTFVGFVLPFLVVAGAIAIPVIALVVVLARRRGRAQSAHGAREH